MGKFMSIYEMLRKNAEIYGSKTAIMYDTFEAGYDKLYEDVVKKANHLGQFEGGKIGIYGPASYRWIVNMLGTVVSGKDAVLTDFFMPHNVRKKMFDKVGVNYALCSTNQYILSDSDAIMLPGADRENVDGISYDENTKEGSIIVFSASASECNRPVVINSSMLFSAIDLISSNFECDENDRILAQIELSQVYGLVYSLLWPLAEGMCVCVGRGLRHIDADTYYYRPTLIPFNPSMGMYLKRVKAYNPELKTVIVGGAPCPFRLYEFLRDKGLKVYEIYGHPEATGCIGINGFVDDSYKLFSKDSVQLGDDGEIIVSGPCVFGEKLYTGDYGRFDSNGRLVITRKNENVFLLPTGERVCRKVTEEEITAINGIAQAFVRMVDDKLVAVIIPISQDDNEDKFRKRIFKFNESKGYRWEIQKIILTQRNMIMDENGDLDEEKLLSVIENG